MLESKENEGLQTSNAGLTRPSFLIGDGEQQEKLYHLKSMWANTDC